MRIIFAGLVAALLAGCASTPIDGQPVASRIVAVAHLAPAGSFEATVAPTYVRLTLLRQTAARRLTQGRITVDTAREIQARADAVRATLDTAVAAERSGDATRAAALAAQASTDLAAAARLLEGR